MSYRRVIIGLVLVMFLRALPGFSQGGTAVLNGRVTDSAGLAAIGAKVDAQNADTNANYSTETNEAGQYSLPSLPPGKYQITVDKEGFNRIIRPDVELHVASNISIDFSLQVGSVSQSVTVEGGAPLVNTTNSSLGGLVQDTEVAELPMNGRNYIDLTLMQPGIVPANNVSHTGSYSGTWFSSNGTSIRSNNFMMDGAIMQDINNGSTANFAGRTLGLDGIQEYRVITGSFSAEYPLVAGSQTIMVSKSGTNQFHGSAFEYLRNSVLDSANFFDKPTASNGFRRLPLFQRNNFGGSFGGPIKKDKTFFFGTFERVRENLGVTNTENVLADGCHPPGANAGNNYGAGTVVWNGTGAQPIGSIGPCAQLGTNPGGAGTNSVTISALTAPLVALFPSPNLPTNTGLFQRTDPYNQPDTDNFGQIRVDHTFSTKDTLFGRYSVDDDAAITAVPFPQYFNNPRLTRHQYATISENHIFSTSVLNNARISFSRTASTRTSESDLRGSQYSFVPGQYIGTLTTSLTPFGPSATAPNIQTQNIISLSDDISWTHGRHSLKFGTLVNRYIQYGLNSQSFHGTLAFTKVADFLRGAANNYQANSLGSILDRTYVFWTTGFYAQDDWRLRSNFTLNAGLRYEPAPGYRFQEIHGISSALVNPLTDTSLAVGPLFKNNPTLKNWSPRLGFAWDVWGNGKTAVRGGASLLYDIANLGNGFLNFNVAQPPFSFKSSVTIATPTVNDFKLPFEFQPSALGLSLQIGDYDFKQPHFFTENLTVDQQLPFSMVLSLSYAGSRGMRLFTTKEINPCLATAFQPDGTPFWPSACTRLNSVPLPPPINQPWNNIQSFSTSADSSYNSLQAVVTKRMSKGLQFQSSYTWARGFDNTQGGTGDSQFSSTFQTNPYDARFDRALTSFNMVHAWSFNAIYNLPSPKIQERILATLTSGWGMSGIVTMHSGLPFNPSETTERARSGVGGFAAGVDRPSWNTGRDAYNATHGTSPGCVTSNAAAPILAGTPIGTPTLFYDPCAFVLQPVGTLGNVARNSLFGPRFSNVNFSLKKDTKLGFLGEAGNLEFRAEFFNIFNHPNFDMPNSRVFSGAVGNASEAPQSTAALITSTISPSRQLQFSLRVSF